MNNTTYRQREVNWYKVNGKHQGRIVKDADDNDYVIGDFSWNLKHKNKQEHIEPDMKYAVEYA